MLGMSITLMQYNRSENHIIILLVSYLINMSTKYVSHEKNYSWVRHK